MNLCHAIEASASIKPFNFVSESLFVRHSSCERFSSPNTANFQKIKLSKFGRIPHNAFKFSPFGILNSKNDHFSVVNDIDSNEDLNSSVLERRSLNEDSLAEPLNQLQIPNFLSKSSLLSVPLIELSTLLPESIKYSITENFNDIIVGSVTVIGAIAWVRFFDELSRRNILSQKLSRKLVHITTGLIFMLFWPLFSENYVARFFAAAAPIANIFRLVALGTGITVNEAAVKSISREGNPSELLRGPLFYVIIFVIVTLCFWRSSPVAPISLGLMCAGDGIADIVGRKYGKENKLPWNSQKSFAGSISMFCFGTLASLLFAYYFCSFGYYTCDWKSTFAKTAVVALVCTIVESLPVQIDDNFSVPCTAILMSVFLFSVNPFL